MHTVKQMMMMMMMRIRMMIVMMMLLWNTHGDDDSEAPFCWALLGLLESLTLSSLFNNTLLPLSKLLLLPESVSSCFSFCSLKSGGEGEEVEGGEGEEKGVEVDEEDGHGEGGNVLLFSST